MEIQTNTTMQPVVPITPGTSSPSRQAASPAAAATAAVVPVALFPAAVSPDVNPNTVGHVTMTSLADDKRHVSAASTSLALKLKKCDAKTDPATWIIPRY